MSRFMYLSDDLEELQQRAVTAAAERYLLADRLYKLCEECGELITAVNRLLRRDRPEATMDAVIDELVDVNNVAMQVLQRLCYQDKTDRIAAVMREKLEKTLRIAESSEGEYE